MTPCGVAAQACNHTLYHCDRSGLLQGTWAVKKTPDGKRVACCECGKFYGYEARRKSAQSAAIGDDQLSGHSLPLFDRGAERPVFSRPARTDATERAVNSDEERDVFSLPLVRPDGQHAAHGPAQASDMLKSQTQRQLFE